MEDTKITDEILEEFKTMKRTEELPMGFVYGPYIPQTTSASINGVRVWDSRWWMNILCKINWFFHFKLRKNHKKYTNRKIDTSYYSTMEFNTETD